MCIYFNIHHFYFNFNRKLKNKRNHYYILIFMYHEIIIFILIFITYLLFSKYNFHRNNRIVFIYRKKYVYNILVFKHNQK